MNLLLRTTCVLALATPLFGATLVEDLEEPESPHEIRAWADAEGWHLRWQTTAPGAMVEGDLILRGAGEFSAVHPVGPEDAGIRVEAAPRRIRFRGRAGEDSRGLDVYGGGEAIACLATVDGLEDLEALRVGAEGDRAPLGLPFLVAAHRTGHRVEEVPPDAWLAGGELPDTVSTVEAWSAANGGDPAPGAVRLWVDEGGLHLRWLGGEIPSGVLRAVGGFLEVLGEPGDSLSLVGATSPLSVGLAADTVYVEVKLGSLPAQYEIGASRRASERSRLLLVP